MRPSALPSVPLSMTKWYAKPLIMPRARCAWSKASALPALVALWWITMNSHCRTGATSPALTSWVPESRTANQLIFRRQHIRRQLAGDQFRNLRFQHHVAVLLRAFGDVTAAVNQRDRPRAIGRNRQRDVHAPVFELIADLVQQRIQMRAEFGGDGNGVFKFALEFFQPVRISLDLVDLVERHNARLAPRVDLVQYDFHRLDLFVSLRMTDVNDVQQQVGLGHLLQRRLERLDKMMRDRKS